MKIELSSQSVNFLDVVLNLNNNSYHPYRKENAKQIYVNCKSNHPGVIKREIPKMIQKRLSSLSKSKDLFDIAKAPYQKALTDSGYNTQIEFDAKCNITQKKKRKRKKKVFYYNPPYCTSVKTNIGREFLKIIEKHFPKSGPLNKIFNRNTIKISYSCMPNFASQLKRHNQKILRDNTDNSITEDKTCNCKERNECPVNGSCLTSGVIYKATVSHNSKNMVYIGSTGRKFKTRYNEHIQSFKNKSKMESTRLSKFIHSIKTNEIDLKKTIKWEFLHRTNQNKPGLICSLCNLERMEIAFASTKSLLNSRSELIGKCKHFAKFYFKT